MRKISEYVIVIPEKADINELRAAAFIRDNVKLVCGKMLPIVRDNQVPVPCEIAVGATNREKLDGQVFERYSDPNRVSNWEYQMKTVGERFYLTGLGLPPEEPRPFSSYRSMDDGKIGTVMAAYRFVEDILDYDFLYATYITPPENEELLMPESYDYVFTREELRKKEPVLYDSAAFYTLNCAEELNWNMGCMIFKSQSGRIVVIDGGHSSETERFLRILKKITNQEVPHVSAWLFSHLHGDHYGVYRELCNNEKYRGAITVDGFYCNLATEEFYTSLSTEKWVGFAEVRKTLLNSESTIGAKVHTLKKGDVITVDELEFKVLHVPEEEYYTKMNTNDSSVVYKFTYDGKQTMMLLGDAEYVCSNDLTQNCAELLKSDIVQVGHHGCGNVSGECYKLIGADAYIWQVGEKFWYSDNSEALNAHNTGVIRTRAYMMALSPKKENVHVVLDDILSSPLPMKIN